MKNFALLLILSGCFLVSSCKKDSPSEAFNLLTGHVWVSDSLLANGDDAGGPGELLEDFNGEVIFNEDFTGTFGLYSGTWRFAYKETQIVIKTESLPVPLATNIILLTNTSLKITTDFPNALDPLAPIYIRMTFNAK